jgi:hypothetical protein
MKKGTPASRSQGAKGIAPGALEEGGVDDHRPAGGEQLPCQFVQPLVGEFAGLPGVDAAVDRRAAVGLAAMPNRRLRSTSERRRSVIAA